MKVNIYSIKDHKAGFMQPMSRMNDEIMKRDFRNMCADPQGNVLNVNPQDYSLYLLGEYDIDSGVITSNVVWLMDAQDLRQQPQQSQQSKKEDPKDE